MKPNSVSLILCAICPLMFLAQVRPAYGQISGPPLTADYIMDRFNQERRRILRYAEVLGLNDRQLQKIAEVKLHMEKEMVLLDARIDVIDMDLRAELGEDTIDMNTIKKLLKEKYDIEMQRVEGQAAAYASLKSILSRDQRQQMRGTQEIFRGPYGRSSLPEE